MEKLAGVDELVLRIAKRDRNALSELYDRVAPRLFGMLLRILSDREIAAEVLDDAFTRLWSDAARLGQEHASVTAWLMLRSRTVAIEKRHTRKLLPRGTGRRIFSATKPGAWLPRPEEITLIEERRDLLERVLNQLPQSQRQTVEHLVFEGLTETGIAQKTGEPLAKVRTRLRATMGFLRHRLQAVSGTWTVNV